MTSIDDLARRAAAEAHARAAVDIDIDRGLVRILDADERHSEPVTRSGRRGPELGRRRGWMLTAAAALVLGGAGAVVWWPDDSAAPAIVQTPTVPSSTPAPAPSTSPAPSTVPPSTTAAATTTTTITTPPGEAGLAVSYLAPPPIAELEVLGTLDLNDDAGSSWSLAVAPTGVSVLRDGTLHQFTWSGARSDVPLAAPLEWLLAIGPDAVAYGTVSGPNPMDMAVHAVALEGDQTGRTVSTTPIDVNQIAELPAATIGHSPHGLVLRTRPAEPPLVGYVDRAGTPITWPEAPPAATIDATNTVRMTDGRQWALSIERHPDTPATYAGPSAPAPGTDGTYVHWTGIGPPARAGTDFPDSTINVIAVLRPDGSATWRTIPPGFSVTASDVAGTILTHTDDRSGTLTIARLATGSSSAPTPTTTVAPATTPTSPPVSLATTGAPCDPDQPGSGVDFPIRRCDRGWGVVWVRNALAADGDPVEDGDASADFTDAVDAAVRRYQARHGLEPDGLVGPLTWFTMYPEFAAPTGHLVAFDADGSGRIEPAEVGAIGDANAPCEAPSDDSCR